MSEGNAEVPAEGHAEQAPPDEQESSAGKSYSDEQLEQIVQARLARDRKSRGWDELKEKAEAFDQLQESQKSDLQKAQDRAMRAEQKATERAQAADQRLREAAVLSAATNQKAIKPEHLFKLIDTNQVTVGDDGQVTGAEEAVKSFLEANPEYVGNARPGGGADLGARQSAPTKGSFDDVIRQRVAG